MSTDTVRAARAYEVVGHALDGDRTALDAVLASLEAPELRRLTAAVVRALAESMVSRCEALGTPRRDAVAYFRSTNPHRHAVIERRGNEFEQE